MTAKRLRVSNKIGALGQLQLRYRVVGISYVVYTADDTIWYVPLTLNSVL